MLTGGWSCRSNTYESPTRSSMWSRSNRTTNRGTSEVVAEEATEAITVDVVGTGVEGVEDVAGVGEGAEVLEERAGSKENMDSDAEGPGGLQNDTQAGFTDEDMARAEGHFRGRHEQTTFDPGDPLSHGQAAAKRHW